MRMLRINARFKLSDETATVPDALRELAKFLEAQPAPFDERGDDVDYSKPPHTACFSTDHAGFNWNLHLGLWFSGQVGVFELPPQGAWRMLPAEFPGSWTNCNVTLK